MVVIVQFVAILLLLNHSSIFHFYIVNMDLSDMSRGVDMNTIIDSYRAGRSRVSVSKHTRPTEIFIDKASVSAARPEIGSEIEPGLSSGQRLNSNQISEPACVSVTETDDTQKSKINSSATKLIEVEEVFDIKKIIAPRILESDTIFTTSSRVVEYIRVSTSQFRDDVLNEMDKKKNMITQTSKIVKMEDLDEDDHYEAIKLDNAFLDALRSIRRNQMIGLDSSEPLEWRETKLSDSHQIKQDCSQTSNFTDAETNNFYHLGFYHYIVNCIQLETYVSLDPFVIRTHITELVRFFVRQRKRFNVRYLTGDDVSSGKKNTVLEIDHVLDCDVTTNKALKSKMNKFLDTISPRYASVIASSMMFNMSVASRNHFNVATVITGNSSDWEDLKLQVTDIVEPLREIFGSYPVLDLTKLLVRWIDSIRVMNHPITYQINFSRHKIGGQLFIELRRCFNRIKSYLISDDGTIDTDALVIFTSSDCKFDHENVPDNNTGTFTNTGVWHTSLQRIDSPTTEEKLYALKLISVDTFETEVGIPVMTEKLKTCVDTIFGFIDPMFTYFCGLDDDTLSKISSSSHSVVHQRNIWHDYCLKLDGNSYYLNHDGWKASLENQYQSQLYKIFSNNKDLKLVCDLLGSENDTLLCMSFYTFNPNIIYSAMRTLSCLDASSNEIIEIDKFYDYDAPTAIDTSDESDSGNDTDVFDEEQKEKHKKEKTVRDFIKYLSYTIIQMIAHISSFEPTTEEFKKVKKIRQIRRRDKYVSEPHVCSCDADCLVCVKSVKSDNNVYLFGETNFKVSFAVIVEILVDLIDLVALHLDMHMMEVVRLTLSYLYEDIRTEFKEYTAVNHYESVHSQKSLEGNMLRILRMFKLSQIPKNMAMLMMAICFVKRWISDACVYSYEKFAHKPLTPRPLHGGDLTSITNEKRIIEDIDKLITTDHLDVAHILEMLYKERDPCIQFNRCTKDTPCNLAFVKSNITNTKSKLNSVVPVTDHMIEQVSEILNYLLPDTDIKKHKFVERLYLRDNRQDVMNILNIISNHYDLIKIIDPSNKFWNDIVFYTFDCAIYSAYLNRYHIDVSNEHERKILRESSLLKKTSRPTRKELLIKLLNRLDSMIMTKKHRSKNSYESTLSPSSSDEGYENSSVHNTDTNTEIDPTIITICCKDYKDDEHIRVMKLSHTDESSSSSVSNDLIHGLEVDRSDFYAIKMNIDKATLKKPMRMLIDNYKFELSCTDFTSRRIKKMLAKAMKPKKQKSPVNINRFI